MMLCISTVPWSVQKPPLVLPYWQWLAVWKNIISLLQSGGKGPEADRKWLTQAISWVHSRTLIPSSLKPSQKQPEVTCWVVRARILMVWGLVQLGGASATAQPNQALMPHLFSNSDENKLEQKVFFFILRQNVWWTFIAIFFKALQVDNPTFSLCSRRCHCDGNGLFILIQFRVIEMY